MRFKSKGNSVIVKLYKFAAITAVLAIGACKESEIYPNIPLIDFKNYALLLEPITKDTLIKVTIGYKDGDGDIGLNPEDTFPPFNYIPDTFNKNTNPYFDNFHVEYLERKNGVWEPLVNPESKDTITFSARIENITPEGKFKAIRGTMEAEFFLPFYNERSDTILINVWIYDRALHKSNVVQSPVIVLR
ncbi:MAG: hypothetical protein ACK461_08975 [Bacteroidota bacterium]|jgi:hypothetical protein